MDLTVGQSIGVVMPPNHRFGNVVGSVALLFKKQIQKGGPVTVIHPEVRRFFTKIPEVCQLIPQAGAMGE